VFVLALAIIKTKPSAERTKMTSKAGDQSEAGCKDEAKPTKPKVKAAAKRQKGNWSLIRRDKNMKNAYVKLHVLMYAS